MRRICSPSAFHLFIFLDVMYKSLSGEYSSIFCVEECELLRVDRYWASSLRWRYRPVEGGYSGGGVTVSPKFLITPYAEAGMVSPWRFFLLPYTERGQKKGSFWLREVIESSCCLLKFPRNLWGVMSSSWIEVQCLLVSARPMWSNFISDIKWVRSKFLLPLLVFSRNWSLIKSVRGSFYSMFEH